MHPLLEEVGQRFVDRALALEAGQAGEAGGDDLHREMAFAARVVPGMAGMFRAVVDDREPLGSEGGAEAFVDFCGDGAGESIGHGAYIGALLREGQARVASAGRKEGRFHGRVEGQGLCAVPGCPEAGEFRAPPAGGRRPGSNGPGEWRWLCLEHVRAFNAGYNFFSGMSADEIDAAQNPYAGWDRETRAFAHAGGGAPPRWSDFTDPLDAIGARFRRAAAEPPRKDGRELSGQDRKSLGVLGLTPDADRRQLRQRYSELVRRYHPDRNGGDRSHENALQAVLEAYAHLKSRPAFA